MMINAAELNLSLNLWAMRKIMPQVHHVLARNMGSLIYKQVDRFGLQTDPACTLLLLGGTAEAAAARSLYRFCKSCAAPIECRPCACSSCSTSCAQQAILATPICAQHLLRPAARMHAFLPYTAHQCQGASQRTLLSRKRPYWKGLSSLPP